MNKRQFLTITESEKNSIIEQHKKVGYKSGGEEIENILNEQPVRDFVKRGAGYISRLFSRQTLSRFAKTALEESDDVTRILSKKRKNFPNGIGSIDDMMKNISVLTPKERTLVYRIIFRNTQDATERAAIASRFVDNPGFQKQFIKSTEEETVKALKNVGKYTDEQITAITDAWKTLTKGSKTGSWTNVGRTKGSYEALKNMPGWDKMVAKAEAEGGKRFGKLGMGTRERIIRDFVEETIRKGGRVTWRELGQLYKKELGVGAAILISIGLYNFLKDNGVEDVPEDIVTTEEDVMFPVDGEDEDTQETGQDNTANDEAEADGGTEGYYKDELGTRVLRDEESPKGDDVKDLQRRLNELFQFGLIVDGKYGPDTTAKVKEFQRRMNIQIDGDFGPESFGALLKAESGKTNQDNTQSDSATKPEDNLETMEPIIVTDVQTKKDEIEELGLTDELSGIPEDEIIIVQAPENVPQSTTDKVVVRGAKKCPAGKTMMLRKSKEKEVNRKNKKKRKTVAVYRCVKNK